MANEAEEIRDINMAQDLSFIYQNLNSNLLDLINARDIFVLVIICFLSIFLTLLWLLAVWLYLHSRSKLLYKSPKQYRQCA